MLDHEHVRKLRADLGVSQAELARATGINRTVLSGFETGQLALQGDCARRLLDYFAHQGVDLKDAPKTDDALSKGIVRPHHNVFASSMSPDHVERLRTELQWVEQRVRQLEQARCQKGLIGAFFEEDEKERKELFALMARWRTLVLKLQGQSVTEPPQSKRPVTHAESLAQAYIKMRKQQNKARA